MERICLGKITGVHGIKGEVKIKSFTSDDIDIEKFCKEKSAIFLLRTYQFFEKEGMYRRKNKGGEFTNGVDI